MVAGSRNDRRYVPGLVGDRSRRPAERVQQVVQPQLGPGPDQPLGEVGRLGHQQQVPAGHQPMDVGGHGPLGVALVIRVALGLVAVAVAAQVGADDGELAGQPGATACQQAWVWG